MGTSRGLPLQTGGEVFGQVAFSVRAARQASNGASQCADLLRQCCGEPGPGQAGGRGGEQASRAVTVTDTVVRRSGPWSRVRRLNPAGGAQNMGTNVVRFAVSGRDAGLTGCLFTSWMRVGSASARIVTRMVTSWRGR